MSGWYSLVGVLAHERMITMLNTENPITIVVKHSRAVFQNTLSVLRVLKRPQKQAVRRATMKKAAPVLYGSPRVLTKNRSKYAAILGM